MILTTEFIKKYTGGQVEVLGGSGLPGDKDGYRYRGQISNLSLLDDVNQSGLPGQAATLVVELDYLFKFEINALEKVNPEPYKFSLGISAVSEIGSNRLSLYNSVIDELIILYPPNHNKRILEDGTIWKSE